MTTARLQALIFALLGANAGVYALTGRTSEILDAAAWFVLLAAFSLAAFAPALAQRFRHSLALLRYTAAALVLWAALQFVAEGETLDALNAWLWIAVVITLEAELRANRSRPMLHRLSKALCAALLIPALLWLAAGDWFEAYDALLWICAFVVVERGLGQMAYRIKATGDYACQPPT